MRDIVWIIITILCGIYTVSFARYEIKNKRYSSGVFSICLTACAVALAIVRAIL